MPMTLGLNGIFASLSGLVPRKMPKDSTTWSAAVAMPNMAAAVSLIKMQAESLTVAKFLPLAIALKF
jgi:hypothetical protein